jgi:hypothetical protein
MSVRDYIRCHHCRTTYTWDSNDRGQYSSREYCPICQREIVEALSKIPVGFECRYRDINDFDEYSDVNLEMIKEWEAALAERRKTELVPQRVFVGLYDLKNGDSQNIRVVRATSGTHQGKGFRVSTWSLKSEFSIEVPMEYDLLKDAFTGQFWWE